MDFGQLLSRITEQTSPFATGTMHALSIVTPLYRGIWWTLLKKRLSHLHRQTIVSYDVAQTPLKELIALLEMPFLGEPLLIMLVTEHDGTVKTLDERLWKIIQTYRGPHHVVTVVPPSQQLEPSSFHEVIVLPTEVNRELYRLLVQLATDDQRSPETMASHIFSHTDTITFEQACTLVHYHGLLGRLSATFCAEWLPQFIPVQKSLFSLSQHLFARDRFKFYTAWHALAADYPPEFWISFWSEQCWQAYLFHLYVPLQGVPAASKLVKGLPFSFMRHDWKKHTPSSLSRALTQLYAFDSHGKQGGLTIPFELFFEQLLTS